MAYGFRVGGLLYLDGVSRIPLVELDWVAGRRSVAARYKGRSSQIALYVNTFFCLDAVVVKNFICTSNMTRPLPHKPSYMLRT